MEDDNRKNRAQAKRTFNETVRELAAFVRKRDKRVATHQAEQAMLKAQQEEAMKERWAGWVGVWVGRRTCRGAACVPAPCQGQAEHGLQAQPGACPCPIFARILCNPTPQERGRAQGARGARTRVPRGRVGDGGR